MIISCEGHERPFTTAASDIGFRLSPFIPLSTMISDASTAGTELPCMHSLRFSAGRRPGILTSDNAILAFFRLLELVIPCVDLPLFRAVYTVISEKLKVLCESCHPFQSRFFHCSALSFQGLHLSFVSFRPDVVFDLAL
jgi:hypothetical protein